MESRLVCYLKKKYYEKIQWLCYGNLKSYVKCAII